MSGETPGGYPKGRPTWGKALLAVVMFGTTMGAVVTSPPPACGQPLGLPTAKPTPPPPASPPTTQLIPSISISERYDSNVFYIGTGQNLEDYVTTVAPKLNIEHKGSLVVGNVYGMATGEQYVRNPGLSYIAPAGGFAANLDQMVRHLTPKAKLQLRDDFIFTPRPPAFLAPETGSVAPDAFVRGIQASRANSFSNMGVAEGSYALSPATAYKAAYTHQMIRFGTAFATPEFGQFFDTTFQTVNTGPETQISPRDIVSLTYQYQKGDFSGGGFGSGFDTHGGLAGWKRALTPTLTADLSAGAVVLQPSSSMQAIGSAKLEWTYESKTTATASYSRAVTPSFFIGGLPLLSEVVSVLVFHQFTENLSWTNGADYGYNRSQPNPLLIFRSVTARSGLDYILTRWATTNLSYSYGDFKYTLSGQEASFDRHQVMITLRLEWK